ncbi:MAG: hypothetical protein C4K58_00465 [Flavobacteriaceae bacterium]|nr:MAG: hypothetical protein C4K58_00465 [Flavobacteriaceae bacterium]
MKKIIASAFMLFGAFAFAQQSTEANYGVKGGLNLGNAKYEIASVEQTTSVRTSFFLGGFAEKGITDQLNIQVEGQLAFNGTTVKTELDDFTNEKNTLTQIVFNIPVLAEYKVTDDFSLQAGPYLSLLLNSSEDNKSNTENFNTASVGLAFGAEYYFIDGFFVDLRYNQGLGDTSDVRNISYVPNSLQIGVGYKMK